MIIRFDAFLSASFFIFFHTIAFHFLFSLAANRQSCTCICSLLNLRRSLPALWYSAAGRTGSTARRWLRAGSSGRIVRLWLGAENSGRTVRRWLGCGSNSKSLRSSRSLCLWTTASENTASHIRQWILSTEPNLLKVMWVLLCPDKLSTFFAGEK